MDILLALAVCTFVLLVAFLGWSWLSTKRSHPNATGVGGPNDPLSGAGADLRHPDEMRASLDAAAEGSPEAPALHRDR